VETATTVMMVPAAAVLTLVTSVATLIAALLTARLAVALAALVSSLEIAAPPPSPTAAVIGTVLIGRTFVSDLSLGLRFGRFGGRAAKEFLHPAKHSGRLLRFLGRGGRRRASWSPVAVDGPSLGLKAWALLAVFPGPVFASLSLRAVIRTIPPAVLAIRTRSGRTSLVWSSGSGARLAGNVAKRLALPALFDPTRCFRRQNIEFWLWRNLGGR
jgi:hypothetical protein